MIYGSEAASGVLQIFTKKGGVTGPDRPRLDLQVSLGTIESEYTPDGVRVPLTQDYSVQASGGREDFSYRAGASYARTGEWVTGYGSSSLGFAGGLRTVQGPFTAELAVHWSDRDFQPATPPLYRRWPASESCPFCGDPNHKLNDDYALSQNTIGLTLGYQMTPRWSHKLVLEDRLFLTLATRVEDNPHLGEEYGRAVSPRVGASYVRELGPVEVKVRGQYGKGVRPPPDVARVGQVTPSTVYLANPAIGPEEKVGWDAGIDVYWGQRGSLSLTRYDEDGKNLILPVDLDLTTTPTIRQYQNVGRVGSKGWELEGRLELGLVSVQANYAYSDNVIKRLSNQYTATPNSIYQVGDRRFGTPTHSGGGSVTARLLGGSLSMSASVIDDWRELDYIAYYGWRYGGLSGHDARLHCELFGCAVAMEPAYGADDS